MLQKIRQRVSGPIVRRLDQRLNELHIRLDAIERRLSGLEAHVSDDLVPLEELVILTHQEVRALRDDLKAGGAARP